MLYTPSTTNISCSCFEHRPATVFEVIAKLWNSSQFNLVAPVSDCHFNFLTAIDCSNEHVAGLAPATPTWIEDIFVSMRSNLLQIITQWEQNGQGEGGMNSQETEKKMMEVTNDDESLATDNELPRGDNIGGLCGRLPWAQQSCASFLNGRPLYSLYFWEVADAHQILQSSLQRVNNTVGAANSSCAPSTVSSAKRRQRPGHAEGCIHEVLLKEQRH